jgi:myo-inositol 2-dehydrogenase/D-chiro-inositol 1-dehydrogenase
MRDPAERVSYQPFKATDNWFVDEERSGGMIVDLMLHDYDYARWLAGNVRRVFAKSVRAVRPDAPGDYALVTLRFESGAIAHLEGGWAYPRGYFRKGFDIAGTDGVIESHLDATEPVRIHLAHPPHEEISDVAVSKVSVAESPYTLEIEHFYDAVIHDRPFLVTPDDALAALQIALAARESLRTGRSITINQETI